MAVYFIRIQGRVLGPLSTDQLLAMKSKGQLHKFHEISADKVGWHPAADFADLFPEGGSAVRPALTVETPPPIDNFPPAPPLHCRERSEWAPGSLSRLLIIGSAVLLAIGVGAGFWIWQKNLHKPKDNGPPDSTSADTTIKRDGTIDGHQEEEIARGVGLVACGVEYTEALGERWVQGGGSGSCFVISPRGHLLTNRHVIVEIRDLLRGAALKKLLAEKSVTAIPKVWVFLNKKKYEARILHVDDNFDFGILKIDQDTPVFFRLSAAEKIAQRTIVFAYGFPGVARGPLTEDEVMRDAGAKKSGQRPASIDHYFKMRDLESSVSRGIVSRMFPEEVGRPGLERRLWIEHTATINPGNSGGPLIADDGTVVGINTLGGPKGSNLYWSLSPHQIKGEIDRHVPQAVWK